MVFILHGGHGTFIMTGIGHITVSIILIIRIIGIHGPLPTIVRITVEVITAVIPEEDCMSPTEQVTPTHWEVLPVPANACLQEQTDLQRLATLDKAALTVQDLRQVLRDLLP